MESSHALQQTKEDIAASTEWERVVQDLCILLEQISKRQQRKNFEWLSKQEQQELMRVAASQLQRTSAFRDLQSKISATLAQSDVAIPSLVLLSTDDESPPGKESLLNHPSSKLGSEHAAKACAFLLQEHHHLKHYLKKCFNHPLPAELRRAAWKVLLLGDSPAVIQGSGLPKATSLSVASFKEELKEDREISKICKATLQSSPFLSQLARSPVIMEAMKSVMAFWSHHKGDRPSDNDFLLCIPFLYTWQSKLEKEEAGTSVRYTGQMQALLSTLAEVYVSFLEKAQIKVAKTMDENAQEIEDLLHAESPTLYNHLVKILGSKLLADHDAHSQSRIRLKKIICIHLQRMLVGFQCLKYFAASWFLILKHQLLICHSEEDVKRVLIDKHYKLKVTQFQNEIDRRFLGHISSRLKVTPFQTKAPVSKEHEKAISITHPVRSSPPVAAPAHALRKQQESATKRDSSWKHVKDTDPKEKPKFEAQSDLLEQERKKHKKELEELTLEVELLRRKVEGLRERPSTAVGPMSSMLVTAASTENTMSTIPSNSTLLRHDSSAHQQHTSSQQLLSPSEAANLDQPSQTQETLHKQSIVSTRKPYRPFSPGNLTKDDVTNIWFMIFQRFSSAVNFIFHGNEQCQLDTDSQQRSESLVHEKEIQDQ